MGKNNYRFPWEKALAVTAAFIISLVIGTVGYRILVETSWMDSFLNSSLILSGMGPTAEIPDGYGKLFVSLFCIYSGVFIFVIVTVFIGDLLQQVSSATQKTPLVPQSREKP